MLLVQLFEDAMTQKITYDQIDPGEVAPFYSSPGATTGIKSATWTFPAAFVSGSTKTVVTHAIQTTNPIQRGQVAVNACTNTDVALHYNEGAGTAVDVFTHATATGRWF